MALAAAARGARDPRAAALARPRVLHVVHGRAGAADLDRRRRDAHLRDVAAPSRDTAARSPAPCCSSARSAAPRRSRSPRSGSCSRSASTTSARTSGSRRAFVVATVVLGVVLFSRRARGRSRGSSRCCARLRLERPLRAVYEAIHAYRDHVRAARRRLRADARRCRPCACSRSGRPGKAVGVDLSPRPYYVMGPLLFLVLLVPFTINGLAVREAFFVSFLGSLGVDARPGVRDRVPVLPRDDRALAPGRGDPAGRACAAARPTRPMASTASAVVVVTYNALPWLERCLESVRGYETVVVDHGSTDGTVESCGSASRTCASSSRRTRPRRRLEPRHARRDGALRVPAQRRRLGASATASSGSSRSPSARPRRGARRAAAPEHRTGRCSARRAGSRRRGGSRRSTSSCASSRRARAASTRSTPATSTTTTEREAEWLMRRRDARAAARGGAGRRRRRGLLHVQRGGRLAVPHARGRLEGVFFPGAEVVHVGGASHGGRMFTRTCAATCASSPSTAGPAPSARGRRAARVAAGPRGCCSAASAGGATARRRAALLRP